MKAFHLLAILAFFISSPSSAQNQSTHEQATEARSLARLYGAAKYYLQKGEPDKALRYFHSMYMTTNTLKFTHGAEYAEDTFLRSTGINVGIDRYFRSVGVINGTGRQADIPIEPKKKSFNCERGYKGDVTCYEND